MTVINFPTHHERLRARLRAVIDNAAEIFDEQTRQALVSDLDTYIGVWVKDDQFSIQVNEGFSQAQADAIQAAFEPAFQNMRVKAGYLVEQLIRLRFNQATCETLHGPDIDWSPPKAS